MCRIGEMPERIVVALTKGARMRYVALIVLLMLPACAPIFAPGPVARHSPGSLEGQNNPAQAIEGSVVGPAATVVKLGKDGVSQSSTAPAARQVFYDGRAFGLSSGTDVFADHVEVTGPDGLSVVVDGFRTSSSDPARAYADVLGAFRNWWRTLGPVTQAAYLEGVKANNDTVKAAMEKVAPGVFELLRAAMGAA